MKIVIYTWSLSNGGAERVASLWAQGFAKERQNSVCVMLGPFVLEMIMFCPQI